MERMKLTEAAKELNMAPGLVRELMKRERLPIGYAIKQKDKTRWYFVIYRNLVEAYKREVMG